jgi:hypothetical protein
MDYLPRIKTPGEHHRDMLAIARQHVALACARSLCEPEDEKWPDVITRLVDWMQRLQRSHPELLERDDTRLLTH